jgi:aryl-alcohol dehydrogenase-like predicted oxidoreductase
MIRRKPPNRTATRKPPKPTDPNWRGMSPARIGMATMALCSDHEDVTDEERDALDEYIKLGGNLWAL